MNSFRRKLNYQITNQNEESGTSLFNKVSGIAIAISILLAVLETESHIEIQFGELIRKIDLVIGFLFCIEYVCRLWVSPLQHRLCSSFPSKSYRTTSHSNGSSQSTLTEI